MKPIYAFVLRNVPPTTVPRFLLLNSSQMYVKSPNMRLDPGYVIGLSNIEASKKA